MPSDIDETIVGSLGADSIDAMGGNDLVFGGGGNDTLLGSLGNDTLHGDDGNDKLYGGSGVNHLYGGSGNDLIDASGTTASDNYNLVWAGTGRDTIIGSADAFAAGGGLLIAFSYGTAFGTGGLTFDVGANGSGTVVSQITGIVNTSFTFASNFEGTSSADVFNGSNKSNWEGWSGRGGNDTIHGGGGYDELLYDYDNFDGGTGAVRVNFATGRAIDAFGNTDTFDGMEAARGTSKADVFTGSAAIGFLSFGVLGGADTIRGTTAWDRADYTYDERHGGTLGIVANLVIGKIIDGFGTTDTVSLIDEIKGTNFADRMTAGANGVSFDGGAGNDTLIGGLGSDFFDGGAGNDTLIGGAGNDILIGGAGDDLIDLSQTSSSAWIDYILPGTLSDTVGTGNDTILGNAAAYNDGSILALVYIHVLGSGGIIFNVGSNGSGTATSIVSGVVSNTFTFVNHFQGTNEADVFNGSNGSNWEGWAGFGGSDTIHGGGGYDELLYEFDHWGGGTGPVTVNFASGVATDSFGNTDSFDGIEAVSGTSKGDLFIGSAMMPSLTYSGHDGSDTIQGTTGWDIADYSHDQNVSNDGTGGTHGITANLAAGSIIDGFGTTDVVSLIDEILGTEFADRMTAGTAAARLSGLGGNDTLTGGAGRDSLLGGDGVDSLRGGAGADSLIGGLGNDVLAGGSGNDQLSGGAGRDSFVFAAGFGNDRVTDFVAGPGAGDQLDLSAPGLQTGGLAFASVGSGAGTRITVLATGDSIILSNVAFGTFDLASDLLL